MLKFILLAVVVTSCSSQDFDDDDYIACDACQIPDDEFPEEGEMVCFDVTKVYKQVERRVRKCRTMECSEFDIFCVPQEICEWKTAVISVPECQLERKTTYNPIDELIPGKIYEIYSPRYYTHSNYTNSTYCAWNVANSGIVSYHVIYQQLQEPRTQNCYGQGCACPDSVRIKMGSNEAKLCGSNNDTMTSMAYNYHVSPKGLHVKFCSDNKDTARGFLISATKPSGTQKREAEQHQGLSGSVTRRLNHATCQYEYMMRASQPDVPCPDKHTLLNMLEYHNYLMSAHSQKEGMCSGMKYPAKMSSMMVKMNKIEMCAVEYLYHTRDCDFAKRVVKSTNQDLRNIARAVIENRLKTPKWMHPTSKKCTGGGN